MMLRKAAAAAVVTALSFSGVTYAIQLDPTDTASLRRAAGSIASDLLSYYAVDSPGGIPGIFGANQNSSVMPFWYQSGQAWGQLVDYWALTGDDSYNDMASQALASQTGENNDYQPSNQSSHLGNDDQATWAIAALTAAERGLPNAKDTPSWIDLAKTVFDIQASRWDTKQCGGGLRWQLSPTSNGYDFKNADSQGTFFQLATRLYRFTGNQTYADWAEKTFQWMNSSGIVGPQYQVYEGVSIPGCDNATFLNQWTNANGYLLGGSAIMYNATGGNATWKERTSGLLNDSTIFAHTLASDTTAALPGVLTEIICEPFDTCSGQDVAAFKGVLAANLGVAARLAPFTHDGITSFLQASAQAAAMTCTGGSSGTSCSDKWYQQMFDGSTSFGIEQSALAIMLANLEADGQGAEAAGKGSGNPNKASSVRRSVVGLTLALSSLAGFAVFAL